MHHREILHGVVRVTVSVGLPDVAMTAGPATPTEAAVSGVAIATAITGADHAAPLTMVRRLTPRVAEGRSISGGVCLARDLAGSGIGSLPCVNDPRTMPD